MNNLRQKFTKLKTSEISNLLEVLRTSNDLNSAEEDIDKVLQSELLNLGPF